MSHGASGFGYAFALLAKVSGQKKFLAAFEESLKNENENFNHAVSNWFLLDKDAPLKKPPCQWCHGAVGIGIARMAISTQVAPDLEGLEVDIKRALRGASLRGHYLNDSMCCGSLGHIELLRGASLFFNNPAFDIQAKTDFKKVIERAHRSGKYLLGPPGEIPLGLFTGLAGIGYTALRHQETKLPNILIWE
jgi:lantibiotic modifying enzyme